MVAQKDLVQLVVTVTLLARFARSLAMPGGNRFDFNALNIRSLDDPKQSQGFEPLDKIGGGVVVRDLKDMPGGNRFDFNALNIRSLDDPKQSQGFEPLDKIGGGVVVRDLDVPRENAFDYDAPVNFRQSESLRFPLDKIGGGVVVRDLESMDIDKLLSSSAKKSDNSKNGNHGQSGSSKLGSDSDQLYRSRNIHDIDVPTFQNIKLPTSRQDSKRNFDEIDSWGFNKLGKRNFDQIDRVGFKSMDKRNFDEIDSSGFNKLGKRNFDEIDRAGFKNIGRRSIDGTKRNRMQ